MPIRRSVPPPFEEKEEPSTTRGVQTEKKRGGGGYVFVCFSKGTSDKWSRFLRGGRGDKRSSLNIKFARGAKMVGGGEPPLIPSPKRKGEPRFGEGFGGGSGLKGRRIQRRSHILPAPAQGTQGGGEERGRFLRNIRSYRGEGGQTSRNKRRRACNSMRSLAGKQGRAACS